MNIDPKTLLFTDMSADEAAELQEVVEQVERGNMTVHTAWNVDWMSSWFSKGMAQNPNATPILLLATVFPVRAYRSLFEHAKAQMGTPRERHTCSNPECDGGKVEYDYCDECDQPMYKSCEVCSPPKSANDREPKSTRGDGDTFKKLNPFRAEVLEDKAATIGLGGRDHLKKFTTDGICSDGQKKVLKKHGLIRYAHHMWVLTTLGQKLAEHLGYL